MTSTNCKNLDLNKLKDIKMKDLTNTKIWIGDDSELSEKVQKRLFELGYSWSLSGKSIIKIKAGIYIDVDKPKTIYKSIDKSSFNSRDIKEIFLSDLFEGEDLSKVPYTEWRIGDTIERINIGSSDVVIGSKWILLNEPSKYDTKIGYLETRDIRGSFNACNFKLVKRASTIQDDIQDDFVLPEKWYIKSGDQNEMNILNTWASNKIGSKDLYSKYLHHETTHYDQNGEYISGQQFYPRITFEQFKKYVLKQSSVVSTESIKQTNKQLNKEKNGSSKESKSVDDSISRRETKERSNISFGGCGDGLETSNRERKIRSVQIGERTGSEGEGLCTRRRSQRTITI